MAKKSSEDIVSFKGSRFNFIAESKKMVLVKVGKDKKGGAVDVWIAKSFIFNNDYTLVSQIGILEDFEYSVNGAKQEISGDKLISFMEKQDLWQKSTPKKTKTKSDNEDLDDDTELWEV